MRKIVKLVLSMSIYIYIYSSVAIGSVTPVNAEGEPGIVMHRLYNRNNGEHFYTASDVERDSLTVKGWVDEGVGWYAPSEGNPVYRLYNPNAGDHHYTMSEGEKNALLKLGWRDENIGWYSDTNQTVPLLRQYNPNALTGTHNYTTNQEENDSLVSVGWRGEGVGWYAVAAGSYVQTPDVPKYYSQLDPRWSGMMFNGNTFGNTGCGVTGIAMILSGKLHRDILPPEVGRVLCDRGKYNSSILGTSGTSRIVAAQYYGVECTPLGAEDYDGFVNALASGKMCSVMVEGSPYVNGYGTHGIVVFSYDNGNTYVYDPAAGETNGVHSIREIWDHRSTDPNDLDAGTAVFIF